MTANCIFLETSRIPLTLRDIRDLRDFSLISEMYRIIGVSRKIQYGGVRIGVIFV